MIGQGDHGQVLTRSLRTVSFYMYKCMREKTKSNPKQGSRYNE